MRGMNLLRLIDKKRAGRTIRFITEGHPDIRPTKLAKEYLHADANNPFNTKTKTQTLWDYLGQESTETVKEYSDSATAELGFIAATHVLNSRSDLFQLLKKQLKPIIGDRKRTLELLMDLGDDNIKTAQESYDKLLFHSPRIDLTLDEIITFKSEPNYSDRIYHVLLGEKRTVANQDWATAIITSTDSEFTLCCKNKNGNGNNYQSYLAEFSKMSTVLWTRQRFGIILLERLGTPEAKAILEDLANGDKRILPTRDAVDALARWQSK